MSWSSKVLHNDLTFKVNVSSLELFAQLSTCTQAQTVLSQVESRQWQVSIHEQVVESIPALHPHQDSHLLLAVRKNLDKHNNFALLGAPGIKHCVIRGDLSCVIVFTERFHLLDSDRFQLYIC